MNFSCGIDSLGLSIQVFPKEIVTYNSSNGNYLAVYLS